MSRIKINLLSEKKKKSIPVPVGGIIVFLWTIGHVGLLFWGTMWYDQQLTDYKVEMQLDSLELDIKRIEPDQKRKRQMDQELNSIETALSDYQGILSKRMGSWTKILSRFEEFIARSKSIWVTQLRIDEEGAVVLTGISMESPTMEKDDNGKAMALTTKGITDLVKILNQETSFVRNVALNQIQNDEMEKKPVAKFDLTFVIDKNI